MANNVSFYCCHHFSASLFSKAFVAQCYWRLARWIPSTEPVGEETRELDNKRREKSDRLGGTRESESKGREMNAKKCDR